MPQSLNDSISGLGPLQDQEQAVAKLSVANWMGWQDWIPASLLLDVSRWARSRDVLPASWQRSVHPDPLLFRCARFSGHLLSWSQPAQLSRQRSAQSLRPAGARHRSIPRTQLRRHARALSLVFFSWLRPPPSSTLFPYTTLFRIACMPRSTQA